MTEEKPVLVRREGGVCWITLNRPDKLNSVTFEMHQLTCDALDEAEKDRSVGCVVITGAGNRAFSAGADVSNLGKLSPKEAKKNVSEKGHETIMKILRNPKPIVAAVNGFALGGGCELATACDFRIASDKARFGQSEINLGLIPGWGATQLLQRLVGPAKAKEMIITGAMLSAQEAQQIGLVNRVVETDKFEQEVKAFAESLTRGPRVAIAEAKRLINMGMKLEEGLSAEAEAFGKLFATEDLKEGLAAFLGKRKPSFKGK